MFLEDCELVILVDVIKGRLEVTILNIYFFDCSFNREEGMCFLFIVELLVEFI